MAQAGQVHMDDDESAEQDEQQHMDRIDHTHAAEQVDHGRKAGHIP